jgi:ferritin-like metal-binding protein YciE
MQVAELTTRDAKLIQYLNEAYGKEKQLETALEAHIAMTTRPPYKRRLQEHLRETKGHARAVERRIRELGGSAEPVSVPGPDVISEAASKVQEAAHKGAALAQGPLHAVRGTGEQEKQLKNAKTEFSNEAEEIANYTAIEALAESVGDKPTARIARGIRRQEERMASFLERLIPQLTRAVAQAEIPTSERNGAGRRRSASGRATSRRSTRSASSRRRTAAKPTSSRTTGPKTASRTTGRRKSPRSGSTSSRRRTTSGRTTARRTTARRTTGRRTTAARGTRRTSSRGSSRRATARA